MRFHFCVALVSPLALVACSSSNTSGIPSQCNPLGGQGCLLPWPSAAYEVADSSTTTGFRVDIPLNAMPTNGDGITIDPRPQLNYWDGFSPTGFLLAEFPNGVSPTGLPPFTDPAQSLAANSPIVLVDMKTGERAPFFAEIDMNIQPIAPTQANLIIRPLARLNAGDRYAVGILNTVMDQDGKPLKPSPAFQAILDDKDFDHPLFPALKERYPDILAALAAQGVNKDDLVLAWDYTVASDDFLTSDLTTMVNAALPTLGTNGSNLTFTATAQPAITGIYNSYLGTFTSPNFLSDGLNDDSILIRDATTHLPVLTGTYQANYAALVPECVTTMPLPRPIIIFGHGLFGSAASYLSNTLVQSLAENYCVIIVAGNFIGLTQAQIPLAPLAVNDMNKAPEISEKLAQSIIDFITLEVIARGPMATSSTFSYNGTPVMDPTKVYYVGGSLGGIMGNTFMAYDPNITRAVLGVPGGVWSMLFERSNAWTLLIGAAMGSYTDPSLYQLVVALLGMGMEPYDPITTAAHVIANPRSGVPVKSVLMWFAVGDCLVTNIATEVVARTMGIPLLTPSIDMPWGLTPTAGPLASGIVHYNAHPTPLPPTTNVPPATDNGTHENINYEPSSLDFVNEFLLADPQQMTQQCWVDGAPAPCDCSTGACMGSGSGSGT
jgi:hypothetical protein